MTVEADLVQSSHVWPDVFGGYRSEDSSCGSCLASLLYLVIRLSETKKRQTGRQTETIL